MSAPTLDDLREWVSAGAQPATPDAATTSRLAAALAAAVEGIEGRCKAQYVDDEDDDFEAYPESIRLAILMEANRLYMRASSAQGVAGFGDLGGVFRVLSTDPDVEALLGRYLRLDGFS